MVKSDAMVVSARRGSLMPYLRLMRPANVVTAAADVLAGYAVAGFADARALGLLLVSTTGLYAAGVVFNDVFDAKLDAIERPERPIPSGRATVGGAAVLGTILLAAAILSAFMASRTSGVIALLIAGCAVFYDGWGKHIPVVGPVSMASCRGLNLLLGLSAAPLLLSERWYVGLLNFTYVVAITVLSAGEVRGGKRAVSMLALGLLGAVVAGMIVLAIAPGFALIAALPFAVLFSLRVLPPFWRAYREPQAGIIRSAVKVGVLSLIVLDSAIGAGYGGILYGAMILSLSWLAGRMARLFAVT